MKGTPFLTSVVDSGREFLFSHVGQLFVVLSSASHQTRMLRSFPLLGVIRRNLSTSVIRMVNQNEGDNTEPMIPPYEEKLGETMELKKARLG